MSVLTFLIGCGLQINCPKFDQGILDWIPYEMNDTIQLINTSTDSLMTFVINETTIDHKTHYTMGSKCGTCDDNIYMNGSDSLGIIIFLNENKIKSWTYSIKGTYFEDHNSDYSEAVDYTWGDQVYDQVRIYDKKGQDEKFVKLIIARGWGIVGLVDQVGNTWILNNTHPKAIKSGTIEINNTSCG